MKYYIINTKYKYYPYHTGGGTFTWLIGHAKEYLFADAEEECKWLYNRDRMIDRIVIGGSTEPYLKIIQKTIVLRKEKLRKLNEIKILEQ
jgi:hypothetical protein